MATYDIVSGPCLLDLMLALFEPEPVGVPIIGLSGLRIVSFVYEMNETVMAHPFDDQGKKLTDEILAVITLVERLDEKDEKGEKIRNQWRIEGKCSRYFGRDTNIQFPFQATYNTQSRKGKLTWEEKRPGTWAR